VKEQNRGSHTQGLTAEQITESPISLPEVMQAANLKPEELQTIQLLHEAREKGESISRKDLIQDLSPEENSQIPRTTLRDDLRRVNRKLRAFGWEIVHPLHFSQGKVREIRGRYIIKTQDEVQEVPPSQSSKKHEASLGKEHSPNKKVIKKPPTPIDSIPMLPQTKEIKPLPTSAIAWESLQAKEEKIKKEKLEQLRQDIVLNFTLAFLSHVKTDNIKKLTRDPTKNWFGQIPKEFSFDSIFGTDPKEDEKTKDRKHTVSLVKGLCETVDRLWELESNTVTTPKEKQILTMCGELKQKGIDKDMVKNIAGEHYGVEIPDKSEAAVV
jgi:hypothetical protein